MKRAVIVIAIFAVLMLLTVAAQESPADVEMSVSHQATVE